MASQDLDSDRPEQRPRLREFGDGSGATAPAVVLYDADGNAYGLFNPLFVLPVDPFLSVRAFALNPTHGESMHEADGSYGGTPVPVYDADTALWTATEEVGASFTAVSSDQAHNGANSAKWDAIATGDTIQFAKPTPPQDLTNYVALTFWVYVGSGYGAGNTITVFGWDGGVVGTPLAIESKIDQNLHGVWQQVPLTLAELGLEGASIDAIRMSFVKNAAPTTVYIDDIDWQETAGAEVFVIGAPPGTIFSADRFVLVTVDDFDSSVVDGTMIGLDPTEFLGGPPLTNGILVELFLFGAATPVQTVFKNNCDALFGDGRITSSMSKNGNTCIQTVITFDHPVILRGTPPGEDFFSFTIRDDMRSYTRVAIFAIGGFRVA